MRVLESRGKHNEAADLRHDAASIVKNAKPPKSNLNAQQRQGLSYFKNHDSIAIASFVDLGGLCTESYV